MITKVCIRCFVNHLIMDLTLDVIAAREEAIKSHIYRDDRRKMFACNLCSFGASSRYKAFCHIEAKHYKDDTITYTCKLCGKSASSRNALGSHMTREHKEEKYQVM